MTALLALTVGVLFGSGVYLLLQRSLARLVVGLMLLGNGANLTVFLAGGLVRGAPPMVPVGATMPSVGVADPLPQALVLTAIVIGFALVAFAVVLVWRIFEQTGEDDLDTLRSTDR